MDDARKKLRVCLLCVVAAAVIIGCIYFFNDIRNQEQISEGTLVMQEMTEGGGALWLEAMKKYT